MSYFPIFVNLEGKHILVIGGGTIAARRIRTLLEFGCGITVVSPEICGELRELMGLHSVCDQIIWKKKIYETGDLDLKMDLPPKTDELLEWKTRKYEFVLSAATGEINDIVTRDCRKKKLPVNNASDRGQCDFYFPGIAKEGEIVVGITSGGRDHALAARISESVRILLKKLFC